MKVIKTLTLTNFRLQSSLTVEFSPKTSLILGPNASGKTAIIEAIYLASTGDSFRAGKIEEMIEFDKELARVNLVLLKQARQPNTANFAKPEIDALEILLTRGLVQGKKTQYRLFSFNEVRKRKRDFIGQFQTVLFRPEDMRLIEGSPSRRRGFLDQILTNLFYEYRVSLKTYENTLKRRNRLLPLVREGEQTVNVLEYWNLSLVKNGQIIQAYRQRLLDWLSKTELPFNYTVTYLPRVINQARQKQYLKREIAAGHSLIGPHKDDLQVNFFDKKTNKGLDVAVYGSRGQQRLAVLWLKAGASQYIEAKTEQQIIWLLDDILSELDQKSRRLVLELTKNRQTIITSTSERVKELVEAEKLIRLG